MEGFHGILRARSKDLPDFVGFDRIPTGGSRQGVPDYE